jgi:PPM family protein phosphatase
VSNKISASAASSLTETAPVVESKVPVAAFGDSDIGLVRNGNEDAFAVRPEIGLFLVADGMGGAAAGEVASRMLVREVEMAVDDGATTWPMDTGVVTPESGARRLLAGIHRANQRIHTIAQRRARMKGMGTTLVSLLLLKRCAMIAHVGDSRIYRLRDGALEALTRDHSLVNELIERGFMSPEDAKTSPRRHVIMRAVGVQPTVEIDTKIIDVRAGDVFLLCSDGLTGEVEDDAIRRVLVENEDPRVAVHQLIDLANDAGGADNVTAVVVRIDGTG